MMIHCINWITASEIGIAKIARRESTTSSGMLFANARFAKPLDTELLAKEIPQYSMVCTLEDHAIHGGFGSAVLECVSDNGIVCQDHIHRFGMTDRFIPHASQAEQYALNGYDVEGIVKYILENRQIKKAAVSA